MSMNKILIFLEVPSVGLKFETYVPDFLPIREVTKLLAYVSENLSSHFYISSGEEFLCLKDGSILDEKLMLKNYDIENGDHLMMI